jgi:cyclic pyranopterin monophosphate synthase
MTKPESGQTARLMSVSIPNCLGACQIGRMRSSSGMARASSRRGSVRLTHVDQSGAVRMVDVGSKPVSQREAVATGFIRLAAGTLDLIQRDALAKGNVLAVARVAGIQAAKRTWELIPLCHQLPLSAVEVALSMRPDGITIEARARTVARTGVEMEALTAVAAAALTVYDMCKAVDKMMAIEDVRLVAKSKEPAPAG